MASKTQDFPHPFGPAIRTTSDRLWSSSCRMALKLTIVRSVMRILKSRLLLLLSPSAVARARTATRWAENPASAGRGDAHALRCPLHDRLNSLAANDVEQRQGW